MPFGHFMETCHWDILKGDGMLVNFTKNGEAVDIFLGQVNMLVKKYSPEIEHPHENQCLSSDKNPNHRGRD